MSRTPFFGFVAGITYGLASIAAGAEQRPWWDDFPLVMKSDSVTELRDYNASISFNNGCASASWGTYITRKSVPVDIQAQFEDAGYKTISYFECYGTSGTYVAELGIDLGSGAPILHNFWDWSLYSGRTIQWLGAPDWFEDKAYAQPYTRTHPLYGGGLMTYPNGTVAIGDEGESDPRDSRVYDAGGAKNILGELVYEYETVASPPYAGLIQIGSDYAGLLWIHKDSACPCWLELDRAAVKYMTRLRGLDGMWTDNFSSADSFGWTSPVATGFGDWSIMRFQTHLRDHFTTEQLALMGVGNLTTFNIRTALRAQCADWGGNDSNLSDPVWKSPDWMDLPLWRAYLIFKRQAGTEALHNYYREVKEAAAQGGVGQFMVAGNDIPAMSLGWPRGELDMASFECPLGWFVDCGSYGFGLPPEVRMSPRYKLAREHAKSRFVVPWLYFDQLGGYDAYRHKKGVVDTLFYEMLANHALPLAYPDEPRIPDSREVFAEFNSFVKSAKDTFGNRAAVEDVGVYYGSSSLLMMVTPGGVASLEDQPHQFGVYGWGTALGDLHYQYRYLPEWKLNAASLARLRLLIIPHAAVLDPVDVAGVLQPWVESGGRLIVTGNSGERRGESHNFDVNGAGLSLAPLTGVAAMDPPPVETVNTVGEGVVLYLPDNLGAQYFTNRSERAVLLPEVRDALDCVMAAAPPTAVSAPEVDRSVGLTTYTDPAVGKLFVDINNMNCNPETDVITPTAPLSFSVRVSPWSDSPDVTATACSPDGTLSVSVTQQDGALQISTGSIMRYASVVVTFPDADRDGLSDAAEGILGTDPARLDSDADGLSDYLEIFHDGRFGFDEAADTDPFNADTDGDGVRDGTEVTFGSNPLNAGDTVVLPAAMAGAAALALLGLGIRQLYKRDRRSA